LARTTVTFTKFSSFVEVIQKEEDEFVWGAMAKLKDKVKENAGLVTTWTQKRKEVIEVPNIRVCNLLALSRDLQWEMVDQTHIQNKVLTVGATLVTVLERPVEFMMLL